MICTRFFEELSLFTEKGQSKIESFYEQVVYVEEIQTIREA